MFAAALQSPLPSFACADALVPTDTATLSINAPSYWGAASFTDDTSLPNVPFVSIHSQVLAETCELEWFGLMRRMSGGVPGVEFKKQAIELFFSALRRAMLAAQ